MEVHKGMKVNGMERNVFNQGKWIEKNEIEWNYVTLIECFKIKEWKRMKMNTMYK